MQTQAPCIAAKFFNLSENREVHISMHLSCVFFFSFFFPSIKGNKADMNFNMNLLLAAPVCHKHLTNVNILSLWLVTASLCLSVPEDIDSG